MICQGLGASCSSIPEEKAVNAEFLTDVIFLDKRPMFQIELIDGHCWFCSSKLKAQAAKE
jgi:hypothetical protein